MDYFAGIRSLKLTAKAPARLRHPKRKFIFQPLIFRCYVSFREGRPKEHFVLVIGCGNPPPRNAPTIQVGNYSDIPLPETKPASLHLNMDTWKTIRLPLGRCASSILDPGVRQDFHRRGGFLRAHQFHFAFLGALKL